MGSSLVAWHIGRPDLVRAAIVIVFFGKFPSLNPPTDGEDRLCLDLLSQFGFGTGNQCFLFIINLILRFV